MTVTIPRPVDRDLAARPCPRVSTPSTSDDIVNARRYPFTTTVQYAPEGMMRVPGGIDAFDAAYECEHGRLPSDRSDPCGCYSADQERAQPLFIRMERNDTNGTGKARPKTRPRRKPAITPEEARKMLNDVAGSQDTEAPYGRKSDGSPRRKPGRQPKVVAAAATPAQKRIPTPEPPAEPDFIAEKRREIDQRLRELVDEREVKSGLRDQLNARLYEIDEEAEKLRKFQELLA